MRFWKAEFSVCFLQYQAIKVKKKVTENLRNREKQPRKRAIGTQKIPHFPPSSVWKWRSKSGCGVVNSEF